MAQTLLVVGNHRPALTIVRSLGRDFEVVVGRAERTSHVEDSRWVNGLWRHPSSRSPTFAPALEAVIARCGVDVLFPVGDDELAVVSSRDDWGATVVSPSAEVVRACQDKGTFLTLAEELGIATAPFEVVAREGLAAAARRVGFPCVIKAVHQLDDAFGDKAIVCLHERDLGPVLERAAEDGPRLAGFVVQRYVTGRRHNVYFAAQGGSLVGAMEASVRRTTLRDGTGYTVESLSVPLNPRLREATARLVDALGYHGIGHTQFLVDDAGTSLLELNPRMGAAFALSRSCGFDFARAGVELALGRDPSLPATYPVGRRFAWTRGDLRGLYRALRLRELGGGPALGWLVAAVRNAVAADIHATWSWRDPVPALKLLAQRSKRAA